MKKENNQHTKIYHFNKKQIKHTKNLNQKQKTAKLASVMTYCQCCKKQITKKNKVNDIYLCDSCKNFKLSDNVPRNREDKTQRYINWEDDLDYLYHHFWLEGDI